MELFEGRTDKPSTCSDFAMSASEVAVSITGLRWVQSVLGPI
jgi:hypothetical protein